MSWKTPWAGCVAAALALVWSGEVWAQWRRQLNPPSRYGYNAAPPSAYGVRPTSGFGTRTGRIVTTEALRKDQPGTGWTRTPAEWDSWARRGGVNPRWESFLRAIAEYRRGAGTPAVYEKAATQGAARRAGPARFTPLTGP